MRLIFILIILLSNLSANATECAANIGNDEIYTGKKTSICFDEFLATCENYSGGNERLASECMLQYFAHAAAQISRDSRCLFETPINFERLTSSELIGAISRCGRVIAESCSVYGNNSWRRTNCQYRAAVAGNLHVFELIKRGQDQK